MDVHIDTRDGVQLPCDYRVEELVVFALRHMQCPDNCEVSVSFVDEEEIQALNDEYRGVCSVTDVLSFPCDDPYEADPAEELIELGDIVICPSVIDEQRHEFGTSFAQEASLMTVHSVLHLLGYDHMEPEEREEMEAFEKEILEAWGIRGLR
ncbi:MAG: rRNA maturation RNase YbeY [Coriobacteriaceae bacterium]|nr:rRNA maturation RNase YbeY [Coriobacteriaceae bacterium]